MKPFTHHSYQSYLDEHKLMASRCLPTGELFLPPRPICPHTFSEEMEWVALSGRGELAAFTTIHIGTTEMIAAGYDRKNPYCAGVVRLAEGPLISGQILGVDASRPEAIAIGTPLRAAFITRGEGEKQHTVLAFEVADVPH